jgi:hypothetical protein
MEYGYKAADLRGTRLASPMEGAEITILSADGEVMAVIGFLPGLHSLMEIGQYIPANGGFTVEGGVLLRRTSERGVVALRDDMAESGANADYQPVRMTDGEAALLRMVKGLQARVDNTDKRASLMARRIAAKEPQADPDLVQTDIPAEEPAEPDSAPEKRPSKDPSPSE